MFDYGIMRLDLDFYGRKVMNMSKLKVRIYPALSGDCFLISMGQVHQKHILIDGGYPDTYKDYLKKDLEEISSRGERLDLLVVSHIDQDHVGGVISFLEDNNKNNRITINEVWHNSFRHLDLNKKTKTPISDKEKTYLEGVIRKGLYLKHPIHKGGSHIVDISATEGSTLASLISKGKYPWNTDFNGKAIDCDKYHKIDKGSYKLWILSPNTESLNRLGKWWLNELKKKSEDFVIGNEAVFEDAFECAQLNDFDIGVTSRDISSSEKALTDEMMKKVIEKNDEVDKKITNLSSIAFILEYDEKYLMFLGDSNPDIVAESLRKLKENKHLDIELFNLVKISHHGSKKNINNALASQIASKIYVFSTNGEYGHPDLETLARIIYFNNNIEKNCIFNYLSAASNLSIDEALGKRYKIFNTVSDGDHTVTIEL